MRPLGISLSTPSRTARKGFCLNLASRTRSSLCLVVPKASVSCKRRLCLRLVQQVGYNLKTPGGPLLPACFPSDPVYKRNQYRGQ